MGVAPPTQGVEAILDAPDFPGSGQIVIVCTLGRGIRVNIG